MRAKFFLFTAALLTIAFFAFIIVKQQNDALKKQVAYLENPKK